MGRKIPGRKHHGVRDPEKQRAERLKSIEHKIDSAPTNPDDQPIPKSLTKLVELKNIARGDKNRKKNKKPKPAPMFERYSGEKDRQFLNRINTICQTVKKEAAFEIKYGVKIKKNPETGEVEEVVKRPKDEIEQHIEKIRSEKKNKGKKKQVNNSQQKQTDDSEPKLTKSMKRRKKIEEKKLKKMQFSDENDKPLRDFVEFGEIVHAPPSLTAPKKANVEDNTPKPGKKQLLLKSLLNQSEKSVEQEQKPKDKASQTLNKLKKTAINKKGKRKDLPHALRRQLEKEQKEVIEAYKEMKKQKYKR